MKVDNGNVLRVTKASPNVHLDWSLDGTSGPFTVKRSLSFTFSNPVYLGPAQTAKTYNDAVLGNATNYAYEAFRRTLADTLYFYHADHLGTPIAMTNSAGTLVWRAEHTPFGGIYALTVGTITNNLRFPGQYYDSETGLAQNYFRDYKHNTGRYWEPDPIVLSRGPNLYPYVFNNPLFLFDVAGKQAEGVGSMKGCIKGLRLATQSYKQFEHAFGAAGAIGGAGMGGVAGFVLGGMLTSETGGWGALPGAFGGVVAGGLMGYFGWYEGYYGFDWRAAEIGARKALDDCMHNAGVCDKNLADQTWDNYWVRGN